MTRQKPKLFYTLFDELLWHKDAIEKVSMRIKKAGVCKAFERWGWYASGRLALAKVTRMSSTAHKAFVQGAWWSNHASE